MWLQCGRNSALLIRIQLSCALVLRIYLCSRRSPRLEPSSWSIFFSSSVALCRISKLPSRSFRIAMKAVFDSLVCVAFTTCLTSLISLADNGIWLQIRTNPPVNMTAYTYRPIMCSPCQSMRPIIKGMMHGSAVAPAAPQAPQSQTCVTAA